jgi:hypothetical protein
MVRTLVSSSFALLTGALVLGQGCKQGGIGDPCIPEQEYDPTFSGFSFKEVNVESKSFQCATRVCLVNHFRGRVTCPKGQSAVGGNCFVPGTTDPIVGPREVSEDPNVPAKDRPALNSTRDKCVPPQCDERKAEDTVYCSCRCADAQGRTEGGNFCTCPDAFECKPLVASTGAGNEGLTGSYCIKRKTEYTPTSVCVKHLDTSYNGSCD